MIPLPAERTRMPLDVEPPDPPALHGPQDPGDYDAVEELDEETGGNYRREELAALLDQGAWEAAFTEWAEHTYLTEEQFRVVRDAGLIEAIDLYWNPVAEDVGYRAPSVPADLAGADGPLDRTDVGDVEEALDELGRTVSEALENDYIHRDADEFGYDWE